jgi:hypothetical protein
MYYCDPTLMSVAHSHRRLSTPCRSMPSLAPEELDALCVCLARFLAMSRPPRTSPSGRCTSQYSCRSTHVYLSYTPPVTLPSSSLLLMPPSPTHLPHSNYTASGLSSVQEVRVFAQIPSSLLISPLWSLVPLPSSSPLRWSRCSSYKPWCPGRPPNAQPGLAGS